MAEEVETHAFSGVHLKIHKGEYVAIAGPSGCVKSYKVDIEQVQRPVKEPKS